VIGGLVVIGVLLYLFVPDARVFLDKLLGRARQVTDVPLILGKWRQVDGSLTLEFFADGTLREERLLNTGKGTYKLLPGQRLELEIEGVLWGKNRVTARYTVSGDELLLTPEGGVGIALRYKRVR
jgi:hypothetical protein